ncbi:Mur ligase family protein, partial [Acinetobacter baumannii]
LAYCSKCGSEVRYDEVFYGQLGKWHCTQCDNKRPTPEIFASNIKLATDHTRFTMHLRGELVDVHLLIPGLFNVYNALAAAAAALTLDVT